jgi:hypothetical protein
MLKQPITLVIPGCPIVKKNTRKTSNYRKDKNGKLIMLSNPISYYSKAYTEWGKTALVKCVDLRTKLLADGWELPITDRINLKCLFFFDADRVVDLSNLYEGVQDLLAGNAGVYEDKVPKQYYQIIMDDSVRFIGGHDGSRFLLDYINPRTEVTIEPFIL